MTIMAADIYILIFFNIFLIYFNIKNIILYYLILIFVVFFNSFLLKSSNLSGTERWNGSLTVRGPQVPHWSDPLDRCGHHMSLPYPCHSPYLGLVWGRAVNFPPPRAGGGCCGYGLIWGGSEMGTNLTCGSYSGMIFRPSVLC